MLTQTEAHRETCNGASFKPQLPLPPKSEDFLAQSECFI